jgi:predicted nuclease of predicted toxin-antitoxin system
MAMFLVDEDLPRSLAPALAAAGFSAEDIRDHSLRGRPDDDVLRYAFAHGFAILSGDVGFGSIVRFPLGTHHGIIVARFPNDMPVRSLNEAIIAGLHGLTDDEIAGSLVVIEPGRVRLRRQP